MPLIPRGRGAAVAALIGYWLSTLVMTYPLVRRFTNAIPGDGFDGWQNYWNLWWVRQALLVEHTHPWLTSHAVLPRRRYFFQFPHPSLPTTRRFQLLAGVLGDVGRRPRSLPCSGWRQPAAGAPSSARAPAAWRLSPPASSSPFRPSTSRICWGICRSSAWNGRRFSLLGLTRCGRWRAHQRKRANGPINESAKYKTRLTHHASQCSARDPFSGPGRLVRLVLRSLLPDLHRRGVRLGLRAVLENTSSNGRARRWPATCSDARAAPHSHRCCDGGHLVLWAIVLSPVLAPMIREARASSFMVPDSGGQSPLLRRSARFRCAATVPPVMGAPGRCAEPVALFRATVSEYQVFAGFTVLATGADRQLERLARLRAAQPMVARAFTTRPSSVSGPGSRSCSSSWRSARCCTSPQTALLPGGREIPLPYAALVRAVPFMNISRSVSRYDAMVMLALAVLAALGLNWLIARFRRGRWGSWCAATALIVFEFLPIPYPLSGLGFARLVHHVGARCATRQRAQSADELGSAQLPASPDRPRQTARRRLYQPG